MEPIRTGYEKPIDKLASKMFWKSPWWAKAPVTIIALIKEIQSKVKVNVFVDITSGPPDYFRGENLIGRRFGQLLFIGYCNSKQTKARLKPDNRPKPKWYKGDDWDGRGLKMESRGQEHIWWAICLKCKSITRRNARKVNRHIARYADHCSDCDPSNIHAKKDPLTVEHGCISI